MDLPPPNSSKSPTDKFAFIDKKNISCYFKHDEKCGWLNHVNIPYTFSPSYTFCSFRILNNNDGFCNKEKSLKQFEGFFEKEEHVITGSCLLNGKRVENERQIVLKFKKSKEVEEIIGYMNMKEYVPEDEDSSTDLARFMSKFAMGPRHLVII